MAILQSAKLPKLAIYGEPIKALIQNCQFCTIYTPICTTICTHMHPPYAPIRHHVPPRSAMPAGALPYTCTCGHRAPAKLTVFGRPLANLGVPEHKVMARHHNGQTCTIPSLIRYMIGQKCPELTLLLAGQGCQN